MELLVILIGVLIGGLPTLYFVWELIATITKKVYRKIKYGTSLFD